ncbi:hypothetical protein RhiirA5_348682 [Rhizophagus irregularis]|uniref:BZIP domain-containing protein n=3 Tax=Rhizophagus irregularis TaxID=588596 RepID=A0A2I1F088_9GLOM|nr:hypothetical protein GLOIN_2v1495820 [Rhizophagus irregularis DAOM 181602=DAOM 197198]EXX62184.1 hypothetical protein RirG_164150 [Rhizophagus irregularis DAOM 197198w]PKC15749.1 hypothetical protein RhiirA5_348682 [Rhizophagus irregularis]PKC61279.1 hypothetical protein RhiirA1_425007 [Rhizophagus irregularis]PKY27785.1 hypothetical protein RhiirB3_416382 [Rhizophagus irregularis]POG82528.1 hypothetical protein GLOIN_2v1495820 [Rhizophagus irregularis DAOM 181602=DAOM 197198]|eukprot:XP_025189394.1 hypothetical protein GLOIN_2v1495820 [Rhizophagus irregularis DAOM 181602=DAOM 197198]
MSQNELSGNSNFWPSFNVPPGLGLLDEDFELPENSQGNSVEEAMIPATEQLPLMQLEQQPASLPTQNNVSPFLDLPNDPSIMNYSPPSTFQPLTPTPPIPPNSRYYYPPPPTYMSHPYYNPSTFADPEYFVKFIAEEDKRRRNTAASARFRIKKKMREQALEQNAREMSEKAEVLENRVKELEREIKWLKNLLIEKDSRLLDIQRSDNNKHKDGGDKNSNDNNKN